MQNLPFQTDCLISNMDELKKSPLPCVCQYTQKYFSEELIIWTPDILSSYAVYSLGRGILGPKKKNFQIFIGAPPRKVPICKKKTPVLKFQSIWTRIRGCYRALKFQWKNVL